jgi:hypothetical protein
MNSIILFNNLNLQSYLKGINIKQPLLSKVLDTFMIKFGLLFNLFKSTTLDFNFYPKCFI